MFYKAALGFILVASSSLSFAGSRVQCHVKNAQGVRLEATERLAMGLVFGHGEFFKYSVRFKGEAARIMLIDKRSGDKVIVDEGDFAKGEEVSLTLVTDEAPQAALTLSCKAI